jgi:hypothetical protein
LKPPKHPIYCPNSSLIIWIRTLYKLLGSTITDGRHSFVVLEGRHEEDRTTVIDGEKTMLWNKKMAHIGEKGI